MERTRPLKTGIRRLVRRFGFELHRSTLQRSPGAQFARILSDRRIDLVLDVGASAGHYAMLLREHGYQGDIVSFEPLSVAHGALMAAAAHDPRWRVAPRMALGHENGGAAISITRNSHSSSLLEALPGYESAARGLEVVGVEPVPIRRLDAVALDYLGDAVSVLLKIDTQGYEDRVLAGATGVIPRIAIIQAELSLVPLYAGQLGFDAMRAYLDRLGFELFALLPGHVHRATGRTLQVDGVFVRRSG